MVPASQVSEAEYAAFENASETRSEFVDGQIVAMSGGTMRHNAIGTNLVALLRGALGGRPCRPYGSDQRVRVTATGLTTYPDVTILCGPPLRSPGDRHAVTNPTAIVEVLSPSTESYDRGAKWRHYMRIPTLREYLLVSQDEPRIERFSLGPTGWLYEVYEGTETVPVGALDVTLPLSEVYADLPDE